MSTLTGRLDHLETQLQIFIERRLARLSPLGGGPNNFARRLVSAMRAGAVSAGDGILLAPDRFTVMLHPSQVSVTDTDRETLAELGNLLQEIGKVARLHFRQPPVVDIVPDSKVRPNQMNVIPEFSENLSMNNPVPAVAESRSIPENAFLIINGTQIFPLDRPVINIGRRSSNDLVVADPRVSRRHAQIRGSRGYFEIFDLDSTGGVFVNQQRVSRQVLQPGDVISLAGWPLVYGQEPPRRKTAR